jgi:hypothetical protein
MILASLLIEWINRGAGADKGAPMQQTVTIIRSIGYAFP